MKFRQNLKAMRLDLGLTQKDLGYICGFSEANMSHFETGRRNPTLKNVEKLKIGLNCSYDELLGNNCT